MVTTGSVSDRFDMSSAAFSGTGQERHREGGSCGGTAWLQMGGAEFHPEFSRIVSRMFNWKDSGNPYLYLSTNCLNLYYGIGDAHGFLIFPIRRFSNPFIDPRADAAFCRSRRTPKIASAPLRQRCQPRIVMRRRHGCRSSLEHRGQWTMNGPFKSINKPFYQRVHGP